MKCIKITFESIGSKTEPQFCGRECVPGMSNCYEHASREGMALIIEDLVAYIDALPAEGDNK